MAGSLIFVHGTGVRLDRYKASLTTVDNQARRLGIDQQLIPCAWGDPLGIIFEGKSLPDPPDAAIIERDAQETARWSWLLDDPLAELDMLSIRGVPPSPPPPPGQMPGWVQKLDEIKAYKPGIEVGALLKRIGLGDLWDVAFQKILASGIVTTAFERSDEANELADAGIALARAVVAQLHNEAIDHGRPALTAPIRTRLHDLVVEDWGCKVFGLGSILANFAKRVGTQALRRRRNALNATISAPLGDILLYQSRGNDIREFIRQKVTEANGPVTLVGHSLGGIACVDLLALPDPPRVERLVTVGSQSPYFYEIDALASVKKPNPLPSGFPPWLNIFDRNDFLSFVGERLFPGQVEDYEAKSGASFPEAHSAYFGDENVWQKIRAFIAP
ncbi:hypothetical protein [Bradyrhizobium sp. 150]|uniref:hypothetical protein n=1 Tax=Bradyrhizobium sp. 150 TaxID=2782625 RepID=UPI001FF87B87|nr:hypothetical protein [Bradyrhizobium sp. 150]MCK1675243.1 hypothetical protein [Bradyrhizobium sp. 150]